MNIIAELCDLALWIVVYILLAVSLFLQVFVSKSSVQQWRKRLKETEALPQKQREFFVHEQNKVTKGILRAQACILVIAAVSVYFLGSPILSAVLVFIAIQRIYRSYELFRD